MNTNNLMATITEAVGGITSVLSSVVVLGIFSEIIFGAGVFGVDIVANIIGLIDQLLNAGFVGFLTFAVLVSFWE